MRGCVWGHVTDPVVQIGRTLTPMTPLNLTDIHAQARARYRTALREDARLPLVPRLVHRKE